MIAAVTAVHSLTTLYVDSGVGAAILWAKSGKSRRVYALTEIVELVIPAGRPTLREIIQFVVFLVLGAYISVQVIDPATAAQAFVAGLGWTGLAASGEHKK